MKKKESLYSIDNKVNCEHVKLIIDFKDVFNYVLGEIEDKKQELEETYISDIEHLIEFFVMLRFIPFSRGDEARLSHYVAGIDVTLENLFPDKAKQETIYQEINKRIARVIKLQVPQYNSSKEIDKAFITIECISRTTYALLIESRIV